MAWKTVKAPPLPEPVRGEFFNFKAIGDKLGGWFVQTAPRTKTYDGKAKEVTDYVVRVKDGTQKIVTGNRDLDHQMKQSFADGLKPGHQIVIEYTHNTPIPGMSPQKGFSVKFDDAPQMAMPAFKASEQQSAPPPPPPPPSDDDLFR
jgi:hypothetical protein